MTPANSGSCEEEIALVPEIAVPSPLFFQIRSRFSLAQELNPYQVKHYRFALPPALLATFGTCAHTTSLKCVLPPMRNSYRENAQQGEKGGE